MTGPSLDGAAVKRGNWPAYVIASPQDAESRERLQGPLGQAFTDVKFHDAVDGKQLSYSEMMSKRELLNPMLSGHRVGCLLTHKGVWEDHAKNSEEGEWAAVFESDAILHPDFHHVMKKLQSEHEHEDATNNEKSDIIFLGHCFDQCSADPETDDRALMKDAIRETRAFRPQCTHGYMISRSGAKRLIENAYPIATPLDDGLMWELKGRIVCPQVVRQPWQTWEDRDSPRQSLWPLLSSKIWQMTYKAARFLR